MHQSITVWTRASPARRRHGAPEVVHVAAGRAGRGARGDRGGRVSAAAGQWVITGSMTLHCTALQCQ